jgi:Secretion system C-terminal sorting domain
MKKGLLISIATTILFVLSISSNSFAGIKKVTNARVGHQSVAANHGKASDIVYAVVIDFNGVTSSKSRLTICGNSFPSGVTSKEFAALVDTNKKGEIKIKTKGKNGFRIESDGKIIKLPKGSIATDTLYLVVHEDGSDNGGTTSGIALSVTNSDSSTVTSPSFTYQVSQSLPVELSSFSSSTVGDNVELNWETATEVNNYGFDVERSQDNQNWVKVGFVNGNGNSNSVKDYSYIDNNLTGSGTYYYRLDQIDNDGTQKYSSAITVNYTKGMNFNLEQNYPNPFNPSTTIVYELPQNSHVTLDVYDMMGKRVATLVNEDEGAGKYNVQFSSGKYNLASGIYVYSLRAGNFAATKKFILMK